MKLGRVGVLYCPAYSLVVPPCGEYVVPPGQKVAVISFQDESLNEKSSADGFITNPLTGENLHQAN